MEKLLKGLLEDNHLAYASIIIIGMAFACYLLYNTLSFYILKEQYHGIRFTTKNISYITMMIAVSASVVIVISQIFPITVIPSIRVGFEGIMVKITGFIFGPIVGFITGVITELLVMLFVPSYIHPAFLLTVVAFGFISGLGSSFLKLGKGSNLLIMFLINTFIILFSGAMFYLIKLYNEPVVVFGSTMSNSAYANLFLIVIAVTLGIIWIWAAYYLFSGKKLYLKTFLPIVLFTIAEELFVVVLITPWGDAANIGLPASSIISLVVARLVQVPLKIIANVIIIKTTYDIVNPLVKRDW